MTQDTHLFRAAYRKVFARYVADGSEDALHSAYELGREAVELELSIVELARVHHDALSTALESSAESHRRIVHAAGDFLAESLSAFEMVRRGYAEARDRAQLEHRHAALVRRLSALLADTSLAHDATRSLTETLRLVTETALELTSAGCCIATVDDRRNGHPLTVVSGDEPSGVGAMVAPLEALSGGSLGSLRALAREGERFTEVDEAVLVQLAQMAAAAIERTHLYRS